MDLYSRGHVFSQQGLAGALAILAALPIDLIRAAWLFLFLSATASARQVA
jgi:hypothetical protein